MELTATILTLCLGEKHYIGHDRLGCHVAVCDFSEGRVNWTMSSGKESCPPDGKFYNSFFGFADYMARVDRMAHDYTEMKETEVKINRFAELIQKRWTFNKFVLGCQLQHQPMFLQSLDRSATLITMEGIFCYEQQGNKKRLEDAMRAMNYILNSMGAYLSIVQKFLELDEDRLMVTMDRVDADWPGQRARLMARPQEQQTGGPDVGSAIALADREKIPVINALRYLIEVDQMKDPDYARKVMAEARLAKFAAASAK